MCSLSPFRFLVLIFGIFSQYISLTKSSRVSIENVPFEKHKSEHNETQEDFTSNVKEVQDGLIYSSTVFAILDTEYNDQFCVAAATILRNYFLIIHAEDIDGSIFRSIARWTLDMLNAATNDGVDKQSALQRPPPSLKNVFRPLPQTTEVVANNMSGTSNQISTVSSKPKKRSSKKMTAAVSTTTQSLLRQLFAPYRARK